MVTELLVLLCLGLCLGSEDEKKKETLPKPSLSTRTSLVVERKSKTLKCQAHLQNVTFMLRKLHDFEYPQEQSSAGNKAEFPSTDLEPKDAERYFCAYKTTASHEWSENNELFQLMATDRCNILKVGTLGTVAHTCNPRTLPADTRIIFVTTFTCISILLLFLSIFFIYRCSQQGSSHEESTRRTSHSKLSEQEVTDLPKMEKLSFSTEDPQGVTYTELNATALSKAASAPTEEPPRSSDYATLKV
ncbi:V-set and transmembrane domain-containing protein 1-like [Carlito syrichta]|uniref:V-set and transmembrane domain-containing protein 1-like n=1 Tax=Carlito syrichta TaxID=1868482 RepID=A0A1U7UPE1_CARSF|nr:V-set and transmembrane domain-containing protein 1-like [Carlito syrichta]